MQYPNTIGEIKERAANIRLPINGLAELAGVTPSTAHAKTPDGRERDVRSSTLRKLAEALVAEELRLRNDLLSLHPVQAGTQPC
jgi:hypothetical protein